MLCIAFYKKESGDGANFYYFLKMKHGFIALFQLQWTRTTIEICPIKADFYIAIKKGNAVKVLKKKNAKSSQGQQNSAIASWNAALPEILATFDQKNGVPAIQPRE